ncbi:unnamed protein product, partial [Pleuronectes platessa]
SSHSHLSAYPLLANQAMYNGNQWTGEACSDSRDRVWERHLKPATVNFRSPEANQTAAVVESLIEELARASTRGPPALPSKEPMVRASSIEAFTQATERAGGQGPFIGVPVAKLGKHLQELTVWSTSCSRALVAQLPATLSHLLRFLPAQHQSWFSVLERIGMRHFWAASHEDFPAMPEESQQYLRGPSKVDGTDSPAAVPPLRRSESIKLKRRKPALGDRASSHQQPDWARNGRAACRHTDGDGSQARRAGSGRAEGSC